MLTVVIIIIFLPDLVCGILFTSLFFFHSANYVRLIRSSDYTILTVGTLVYMIMIRKAIENI